MMRVARAIVGGFFILIVAEYCYLYVPVDQLHGAQGQVLSSETQKLEPFVSKNDSAQREFLDQYCVTCHDEAVQTAGLALDTMDLKDIESGAAVWEEVLSKVRGGRMPPLSMPRPEQAVTDGFVAWLEAELDHAATVNPQPGRVPIHRLNRTEYANAIRDLLALEIDSRSVLIDEAASESGFDNTASALSVTPVLVERYLSAARKISRLAVGDPTTPASFELYRVPKMLNQDERTSEEVPFASHGGVAIRHRFPVDAEYVVKIRLQRNVYNHILGLGRPHPLDVRLDGVRITRFTVGGDAPGRPSPDSFAGQLSGSPEWEQYAHGMDQGLEVRFPAQAGTRVLSASFAEFTLEPEGVIQPLQYLGGAAATGTEKNQIYYGNPAIDTLSIGGPYQIEGPGDTDSRKKIFVCHPKEVGDERVCAERILSNLARRAYRRPVTEADVETLLGFYEAGRERGSFDAGIQLALTRILVSPEFLVRIERAPADLAPGTVYRLSDLELASRLSFFLWSSIPDDELLDLAAGRKLQDPGILERQILRMLADKRSKTLIDNFASQWLNLPKLRGAAPHPDTFPLFDENLREAFQEETELFLESQIRADRSVMDIISANYTFVNERLARHYEIPDIYGNAFRRVTFDNNNGRGGLLGQGSILTVTSYPNRTSPVLRGKWVLENLLASPPPDPPPDVEGLTESPPGQPPASMRERLQEHRKNPACASCHVWLDPYGFSLENFDAVGRWRTNNEDGTPVDAVSSTPDGFQLDGVQGLRRFLLSRREQFVEALTEKLLAYAVGRNVEHSDLPAIRKITREAAGDDYRWSSIIQGIVKSVPFQMSTVADTPFATNTPSFLPAAVAEPLIQIGRPKK